MNKEIRKLFRIAPRVLAIPQLPAVPAMPIPPCKITSSRASTFKSLQTTIGNKPPIPKRQRRLIKKNALRTNQGIRKPLNLPATNGNDLHMSAITHSYNVGKKNCSLPRHSRTRSRKERISARARVELIRQIAHLQVLRTTPPRKDRLEMLSIGTRIHVSHSTTSRSAGQV